VQVCSSNQFTCNDRKQQDASEECLTHLDSVHRSKLDLVRHAAAIGTRVGLRKHRVHNGPLAHISEVTFWQMLSNICILDWSGWQGRTSIKAQHKYPSSSVRPTAPVEEDKPGVLPQQILRVLLIASSITATL
jgi:hypothetical protein